MGRTVIVSGFLGAGKTTLIRKLLETSGQDGRTALLENEFGACGVDDLLLEREDLAMRALSSGCICCSLARDFDQAVRELAESCQPELLLIEPSGVAGLSELLEVCRSLPERFGLTDLAAITVVDAEMYERYIKYLGSFYVDQIEHAGAIFCSKLDLVSPEAAHDLSVSLAEKNPHAAIFACPWEVLDIPVLIKSAQAGLARGGHVHGRQRHSHDAKIFTSMVLHPQRPMELKQWETRLRMLAEEVCGRVIRAKGILPGPDNGWFQADYTPGHICLSPWSGRKKCVLTVIGAALEEAHIARLFE